jgi:hypothetical protein
MIVSYSKKATLAKSPFLMAVAPLATSPIPPNARVAVLRPQASVSEMRPPVHVSFA